MELANFAASHITGEATRSYLYVEDVAEAFDIILHKGSVGETYNIGTQKERTVAEVASDIAKHFGLPKHKIENVRDRAFNDRRCCIILCNSSLLAYFSVWRNKVDQDLALKPNVMYVCVYGFLLSLSHNVGACHCWGVRS